MNYPKEYLKAIQEGKEVVSIKVKAVYEREVSWMDNPPENFPFYFDEQKGMRPILFIEKFCKHSKSKWAGKLLKLCLFQKAKIQLVFGWLEKDTGKRRFRRVVDIRGRKCGKSAETAAIAIYMVCGDKEGGAEVYCTANKLDQSKLIYNEIINMRKQSIHFLAILKKRVSDIYHENSMSFIKPLTSGKMDGVNASFFVQDEFHAAKTRVVHDDMIQSQSMREQPLAWLISTNGFLRNLFFDDIYDECSHVAMWEEGFENYQLLPLIYELDNRDEWDKPECWEKANPGLGTIKSFKTLKDNVETAKRNPKFFPTVLTKDFNIPENSSEAWLRYEDVVYDCPFDMEYLRHSYAVAGCDLSSTTDLTCATLIIKKPNDENVYVLQKYFLPKSRVDAIENTNKKEAPYLTWEKQEWITLCDGATIDFHAVTQWFTDMVNTYDIRPLWVGYDAALSGYWREEMEGVGFEMERIRQGPFTWTYPMKQLGGLLEEHKIISNNNPMLRMCLLNTACKTTNKDGINSIQPVKTSSTKRIDGTVSLLNAFTCYLNHEEEYMGYVNYRK